jgi:hypothetical protein
MVEPPTPAHARRVAGYMKVVDVNAMSRLAAAATKVCERQ